MRTYIVKIYSGIFEDSKLEYETQTKGVPKTISWLKSPGFATIEETCFSTADILTELKTRYASEPAIMDYIEMIECEVNE